MGLFVFTLALQLSSALVPAGPAIRSGPPVGVRMAAVAGPQKFPHRSNPHPALLATNPPEPSKTSWRSRLSRVSTVASILCAIDCTVLPAMLVLLPALNVGGVNSALLHKVSHLAAVWFVAPVGGAALAANFLQHRRLLVGACGACGLVLVLLANVHLPHGLLPHGAEHALHAYHTLISLTGCALLLTSQWYSARLLRQAGKCCDHDH